MAFTCARASAICIATFTGESTCMILAGMFYNFCFMKFSVGGLIHFRALVMEVDLAKVGEPKPQSAQLMVFFIVKNDLIDLLKLNIDRF